MDLKLVPIPKSRSIEGSIPPSLKPRTLSLLNIDYLKVPVKYGFEDGGESGEKCCGCFLSRSTQQHPFLPRCPLPKLRSYLLKHDLFIHRGHKATSVRPQLTRIHRCCWKFLSSFLLVDIVDWCAFLLSSRPWLRTTVSGRHGCRVLWWKEWITLWVFSVDHMGVVVHLF